MVYKAKSAKSPETEGLQYHIRMKKGDIPAYVLLPGDPGRVDKIAALWDKQEKVADYRGYRTMKGVYQGAELACMSSGIGSPSLSIGLEELVRIGAHTFIRVGTCGSLQPEMKLGDLVITTGAVRLDGASQDYAMIEYPAVADFRLVDALVKAAEKHKLRYHLGITASTDTFYTGQGRPGYKDYLASHKKHIFKDLQMAGVKNFEMEASALLTLSSIFGVKAGAVCVVVADRVRDTFEVSKQMEEAVAVVASEAVKILQKKSKQTTLLSKAVRRQMKFSGQSIEMIKAKTGGKINVKPRLRHPEEFYGDTKVDAVVKFGSTFQGLIGKYKGQYGKWNKDELRKEGVVVLEHYYDKAKKLMDKVNELAEQVMAKPKFYDDKGFCQEYFELAEKGYELLKKHEKKFGFDKAYGIPVSLERAGLVATRLALELEMNEKLKDEFKVVTKRTHLVDEAENNLTVTIKWREIGKRLKNEEVFLSDFVNPASGASTAALMVALAEVGFKPKKVNHRAISLTQQGVLFNRQALKKMGIATSFYSVGESDSLNQAYYLIGNRGVGDAGHILRHFLPAWYKA